MITESHVKQYGRGLILEHSVKNKKAVKKTKIKIGDRYECRALTEEMWQYPFVGLVEQIYNRTALVRIIATQEEDDHLVIKLDSKAVVPLKNMRQI